MDTLTYHRDESRRFDELDFGPARVLDTEELVSRWHPWFALADSPGTPLRARNALHLARLLTGEEPAEETTWFGTVSETGTRYQVVKQSRRDEYLCVRPSALPDGLRTHRWQVLVDRLAHWRTQPGPDRVLLVALLTQLGFHQYVTALLDTLGPADDPDTQQLTYEACRAIHQLNRQSRVSLDAFAHLARHARRPALRVQAALQLVSALAQDGHAAGQWLYDAEDALPALDDEPAWLACLMRGRHHRAAARYHLVGRRDVDRCAKHLADALTEDDLLATLVDGPVRRHYQLENRQLVLEAYVRLETHTGAGAAPPDAAHALVALDPVDPEPLYAVGALHAACSRWAPAADAFLEAARSGTCRGASAASAAAQCLARLGRRTEAYTAYQLSTELDPAALPAR